MPGERNVNFYKMQNDFENVCVRLKSMKIKSGNKCSACKKNIKENYYYESTDSKYIYHHYCKPSRVAINLTMIENESNDKDLVAKPRVQSDEEKSKFEMVKARSIKYTEKRKIERKSLLEEKKVKDIFWEGRLAYSIDSNVEVSNQNIEFIL